MAIVPIHWFYSFDASGAWRAVALRAAALWRLERKSVSQLACCNFEDQLLALGRWERMCFVLARVLC
jgi:hypothetical protein